jgi:phosphoglycerol transferase MdoB-like AlkP superfamily enzyme
MANKNKELVADLPYSENCKAYIACNIELDRALEELMRQLEEAGVLDKTVICLSSDHYPYGLTNEEISELAGHDIEENFELYKNNLILYNSAMEPVTIDKPCSSIDIIPTLSNLFGFKYDSRLLPGKDILSNSEGLVIMMNNRSFITDELMYNASTKKVTDLEGNEIEVSSDKIQEYKDMVNLKIAMNQLLIENDYYNEIKDHLKFD